jgi:hypothetical protein
MGGFGKSHRCSSPRKRAANGDALVSTPAEADEIAFDPSAEEYKFFVVVAGQLALLRVALFAANHAAARLGRASSVR